MVAIATKQTILAILGCKKRYFAASEVSQISFDKNKCKISQFFNKMMSMLESISRQYSSQIRVTSTILVTNLVRTPV
jgi:uncharacterized protein YsxB (DUF464 family)